MKQRSTTPIARIAGGLAAASVLCVTGLCFCLLDSRGAERVTFEASSAAVGAVVQEAAADARAALPRDDSASAADELETPRAATAEARFRASFLAEARYAEDGLEGAARRFLASDGPDWQKVAVLRAVGDSSEEACAILATAVESLPDVSGPHGESVPRCALRFLAERAVRDPKAREALLCLAWTSENPPAAGLRAAAAASVAAVASGDEVWRLLSALSAESDALVRAGAYEALSRNPDCGAMAACASLGIVRPADATAEDEP